MKDHLSRVADFYKTGPDGGDVPCNPPYDVAAVILSRSDHPFPPLDGVTQSPVMRADGSILDTPGYDPDSRLYYLPDPNPEMPQVPENPTPGDLSAAIKLLREMVCDFPFTAEACRANLFALLLTIVMRSRACYPRLNQASFCDDSRFGSAREAGLGGNRCS